MKCVAVVQARMGSSRLPGKTLKSIAGKPMLQHLLERLKKAKKIDQIVVATTSNSEDQAIEELCHKLEVGCFRGSQDDVLGRVLSALKTFKADVHVEIHGDGPIVDWRVIDHAVDLFTANQWDMVTNALSVTYPPGLEVWVYKTELLNVVSSIAQESKYRESPALYVVQHQNDFKIHNFTAPESLTAPETYLEVDTIDDFGVISAVFENFIPTNPMFLTEDALLFLSKRPDLVKKNQGVERRWKAELP